VTHRNGLITRRNALHDRNASLSGGPCTIANPIENILDINPQIAAESTGSSLSFTGSWGAEYPIGLIAFAGLRTSSNGTMRVTAGSYDSGTVTTWPETGFAGVIDPETGNWTLNGVYPEDVVIALGYTRVFIPTTPVRASSFSVEINDVGSVVSVGVAGAYTVWEPPVNFDYKWTMSPIDSSEKVRVQRGATFIDKRPIFRRLSLGFPYLPEDDFWLGGFDAVVSKGQSEPLWVVPYSDPTEVNKWEKAAVYGLISRESELSNPLFGEYALPIQIDQL